MDRKIDKVTEDDALTVSKPMYTAGTKIKQRILEEEEYLSILDSIVERDFYPELTKLKLQNSYLDALEKSDLEKLREIQVQLEEGSSLRREGSPKDFDVKDEEKEADTKLKSKDQDLTLDEFLLKNTSEDNASFEKIMQITREKHREKYAWLHEKQKLLTDYLDKALLLPGSNEELIKQLDNKPNNLDTWKYVPKNALMYTPDGVELSSGEYIQQKGKMEQEIRHENTRFKDDPFDCAASQTALLEAAQDRANMQKAVGKVGVDGKLEQCGEIPNVLGYSFIATPSPMPGANESPLMTWGAIEGTPLRLDATPAHNSQGPIFKIPEPPRREQIAHSLAEKASKQHREKRRKAFAAASASIFSPKTTPRSCGIPLERWSKLSPAARKLMSNSGASIHTDKSLRASYTPSPNNSKKNLTLRTPNMNTPGSKRIKTPRADRPGSSITDNLLNIPDT